MLKPPVTDACYFCEIIAGTSDQWNVVEKTGQTLIVLNGRQFEIGQCIVVPLRHAPTLLDLDEDEAAAVMNTAKRLSRAMVDLFRTDGILLYQNNGVGSSQEVPHFHSHVVPRRDGSDSGFGPPHLAKLNESLGPPKHNYAVGSADKVQSVEQLRNCIRRA